MQYKHIHDILNETYGERALLNDQKVVLNADLSNIVDFGRALTSNATIQDLMGSCGDMIDKVRKTIYIGQDFIDNAPDCFFDVEEFLGLTEIVRVGANEFAESLEFDCIGTKKGVGQNSFDKLFGKAIPSVKAKYYTKVFDYEQKITVTKDQFIAAFANPTEMAKLFAAWEEQLENKKNWAISCLKYAAFDGGVLEVCATRANDCVVELPSTATPADFFKTVKKVIRKMRGFNNAYSADDLVTSVVDDNLRVAVFGDYMDGISVDMAQVYNPEYWKIPTSNVKELDYFQFATDAQTISGIVDSTTTGKYGKLDKVIAVIYDKRLCGCTFADENVESQYIANERATNMFHLAKMKYIVNGDLPCVVIVANGGGYSEVDNA